MVHSKSNWATGLWAEVVFLLAVVLAPAVASADSYEPDDTAAAAKRVLINAPSVKHDFGKRGDLDWIVFFLCANTSYSIQAANVSAGCDVMMALYKSDGRTTLTREIDDNGPSEGESYVISRVPAGFYYARFRNYDPNVYGTTVTYWVSVNEITGGGIPIETVDERTIGIHKAPSGSAARTAMAVLMPWDRGNRPPYHKHRIEFPGYEETATGTGIDVSICWAREEEKFQPSGQRFPSRSAALFVVKTLQWSGGTPKAIAFGDTVTIAIEFAPDSDPPVWNDIITFQDQDSSAVKMRIVRDIVDGTGVDFRFIPNAQTVDDVERTVTVRNYRGLTGSSGQATYGVVANPSAVPPQTEAHRWSLYR